jgi:hypothetical protein
MHMKATRDEILQQKFHHGKHFHRGHHCNKSVSNVGSEDETQKETQKLIEDKVGSNTVDIKTIKERAAKIVSLLPKENCGKCGFPNCGSFAMAVAKMEAPAFGCHKEPSSGYKISEIIGVEVSQSDREIELNHHLRHQRESGCQEQGHLHHGHGTHHHHGLD